VASATHVPKAAPHLVIQLLEIKGIFFEPD
jgi:hypothetical protein